jgi:[ribosomal protein S18]-alanine N-acetyltransferase
MNALRNTDAAELEVHIVPMRRRHLRAILRVEKQVYPRPWTVSVFTAEMMARDRHYVVAKVGSTLVGYAGMLYAVDDAHVTNVAVDPAWHRHKIGTRLMVALAHAARAHGARNMTLEVRVSNGGAQAMYHRFAFAPAGIRARYYENTEDAIVMWSNDIDQPAYATRLAAIESSIDGRTVMDVP